ncbi:TPA: helix-turn-helix domain-containing protein [Staphylococcus aureus]
MIKFDLKKVMKEKNKTLKELSSNTGLSINTLSLLSTGKSKGIQFDTLEKLLKELRCNINDLIVLDSGFRKLIIKEFSVSKKRLFIFNKLNDDRIYNVECSFKENDSSIENSILLTILFTEKQVETAVSGIFPFKFLKSGKFYYKQTTNGKSKEYIILDFQFVLYILQKAYKENEEFQKMFDFHSQTFSINLIPYNNSFIEFKKTNEEEFLNANIIPASDYLKRLVSFNDNELKFLFNFYTEEEISEELFYNYKAGD